MTESAPDATVRTLIEQLADFATGLSIQELPEPVVHETRRIFLDSMGCALASGRSSRGEIGVRLAQRLGGSDTAASVIGFDRRSSVFGAAFANAELINAMDYDLVLPPGHVTPYVLPGALAVAEDAGRSGADLVVALAVGHEVAYRVGKAMDYVRDIRDGQSVHPPVFGYSASVIGGAAAASLMLGLGTVRMAHALGIAACTAPVNSMWSSVQRRHATTTKFANAGTLSHSGLVASFLALEGHTGDPEVLDDREFGFPRFMGTGRWEPEAISDGLGQEWRFPPDAAYKIFPHCRVPAALLDAVTDLVAEHRIRPEEIEVIRAWGEPQGVLPVWANRDVQDANDAQSSTAHVLSVAAHGITPLRRWQDDSVIFDPSVVALTGRVQYAAHPDYQRLVAEDPARRPSRVEIVARGRVFVDERRYPRGARTSDASTYVPDSELEGKFLSNAADRLSGTSAAEVVARVSRLELLPQLRELMDLLRGTESVPGTETQTGEEPA